MISYKKDFELWYGELPLGLRKSWDLGTPSCLCLKGLTRRPQLLLIIPGTLSRCRSGLFWENKYKVWQRRKKFILHSNYRILLIFSDGHSSNIKFKVIRPEMIDIKQWTLQNGLIWENLKARRCLCSLLIEVNQLEPIFSQANYQNCLGIMQRVRSKGLEELKYWSRYVICGLPTHLNPNGVASRRVQPQPLSPVLRHLEMS